MEEEEEEEEEEEAAEEEGGGETIWNGIFFENLINNLIWDW